MEEGTLIMICMNQVRENAVINFRLWSLFPYSITGC